MDSGLFNISEIETITEMSRERNYYEERRREQLTRVALEIIAVENNSDYIYNSGNSGDGLSVCSCQFIF